MQKNLIDEKLIFKVLSGSLKAKNEFCRISEKIIFGALSRFDQISSDEKKDIAQEIYLKLFNKDMKIIKSWKKNAAFSTYLYKITSFLVFDYLDYKKRSRLIFLDQENKNFNIHDAKEDTHSIINKLSIDICKESLKNIEKEIIELYYDHKLKEREIANELNRPINTISSIKNRALQKIKKMLLQDFKLSRS
tara:strand:+ start:476 stop:1051 length:576 start_codon:yes stop_codon:yes gene_type:complete